MVVCRSSSLLFVFFGWSVSESLKISFYMTMAANGTAMTPFVHGDSYAMFSGSLEEPTDPLAYSYFCFCYALLMRKRPNLSTAAASESRRALIANRVVPSVNQLMMILRMGALETVENRDLLQRLKHISNFLFDM